MTAADATFTSVLLPGARVTMFARDRESLESFRSLVQDWRFARVQMEAVEGGVDEAIATFQSREAPDLLIIETDTIDEGFTQKLEALSAYCSENTAAIVIGPVNDVNLYRRLIGMGISEYLVRPVKPDTLAFDIARSLIERIGATGSRLVTFIGAKGGVGSTVLAEGMAWGMAEIMHQKTMLLDAAGGWSSLSVGMNFEPVTTLSEAVRTAQSGDADAFRRILFQADDRLHVLSTGGDVMLDNTVDPATFERLLDHLMTSYPVVIVDLSAAPVGLRQATLLRAHEIIVVTTPQLPALRAARSLINEIRDLRGGKDDTVIDLIVNMIGSAQKHEIPKADIEAALDRKPSLMLDYKPGLFMAFESEGRKITSSPEGRDIAQTLLQLVAKLIRGAGSDVSGPANDAGGKGLSGILNKFKAKS